jgi:hypothetical protein
LGASSADGGGDFDVFASIRRLYGGVSPHINSLVAVKTQPKEETPDHPEIFMLNISP